MSAYQVIQAITVPMILRRIAFFVSVLCMALFGTANAYQPYPEYLGGDSNFILCDGKMGVAWYVDRSSLAVEKYEPPQYIIAVNVVTVNDADRGNTEISKVKTLRFFYNSDRGEMYIDQDGNDNWRYLDPDGSWAQRGVALPAGEIAFALAYHMKFYGIYDNDFYARI